MDQKPELEPYNEFKDSPLYDILQAIAKLFRRKDKDKKTMNNKKAPFSVPEQDDFSGFLKADNLVKKVMRFFCWLSAVALIVVMVVAFVNVLGEKLGRAGIAWAQGIPNSTAIIQYFHIPLVFLAAGYVTLDQGHTRIDLLIQKWPGVEKVFMLIGHILGAGLSFFISYRAVFVTLADDFANHTRISTTASSWVEWPFTLCHCVGFFLLGVSFVWALVRLVRFWKYPGVNPAVYLYPNEHSDNPAPAEEIPDENADKGGVQA